MVVRRHRLRLLDEPGDPRADRIADSGDHVVPIEQDVRGPLAAGLDDESVDAAGPDPLVWRREAPSRRVAHPDPVFRRLQRSLGCGLGSLDDLMAPLAPKQRKADPGLVAIVGVHEDRVTRAGQSRFLDCGVAGRAVDVVRRVRGEGGDDQHDVPERLGESARPTERGPRCAADLRTERCGGDHAADGFGDFLDLPARGGVLVMGRRAVGDEDVRGETREAARDL